MSNFENHHHFIQEAPPKPDYSENGERIPSRQFRKSRTFMNSRKDSRRSKEKRETDLNGQEIVKNNTTNNKMIKKNSAKLNNIPKPESKGDGVVTLDKVYGASFQAIDLNGIQDKSDDFFPSRPNSRGRSKQRNFDIIEADEEDENHESIRDLKEKLDASDFISNKENDNQMNRTGYNNMDTGNMMMIQQQAPQNSQPKKFRSTIVSLPRQDKRDSSRERIDSGRNSKYGKFPQSKPKRNVSNDRSPRFGREKSQPTEKNYLKTEDTRSISPLRTFGTKFHNPHAGKTIYNDGSQRNEQEFRKSELNFDLKIGYGNQKRSQQSLKGEFYSTQSHIGGGPPLGELSAERGLMGFNEIREHRRQAKETKFLREKGSIDKKFKNEDKMLLEKYGARFGIQPQEYFGGGKASIQQQKIPMVPPNRNLQNEFSRRISTPYHESLRYDTFYRSKK